MAFVYSLVSLSALLLVSQVLSEHPSSCRNGWLKTMGKCYLIKTLPQTWTGARTICDFLGAKLLKIYTSEENSFLKTQLGTQLANHSGDKTNLKFWTGGNNFQVASTWMWSEDEPATFTDWGSGYPQSNADASCLVMDAVSGFSWSNQDCDTTNGFICEIKYVWEQIMRSLSFFVEYTDPFS